ncbi:MAG: hypothetical protein MJ000_09685 [Bacteroidales bacterium]|nr:hypothetical protein [Bacteroidales bacterium]
MTERDTKIELAMNTAFGWTFGVLAAVAAYGVIFCGAVHHIATIAIGAVACMAFRRENRKIKNNHNHVH